MNANIIGLVPRRWGEGEVKLANAGTRSEMEFDTVSSNRVDATCKKLHAK